MPCPGFKLTTSRSRKYIYLEMDHLYAEEFINVEKSYYKYGFTKEQLIKEKYHFFERVLKTLHLILKPKDYVIIRNPAAWAFTE